MIVGRERELGRIVEFVDRAALAPTALVIEGEPGLGKTTLWTYAVECAASRGTRVLAARPAHGEATLSFSALGDLLEDVAAEVLDALPPPRRRALAVALLLEEAGRRRPDQRAVGVAVREALRTLAAESCVAVAVDDAQWLDHDSEAVLRFACRRLRGEPIGVLVALRSDQAGELVGDVARALPCERVELGPLSLGAVHHLLHERLGLILARPRLRRLHELSGGNPFYALELGAAVQRGDVRLEYGEAPPATLAALTMDRIRALPAGTRAALSTAAALARPTLGIVDRDALRPAEDAAIVEVEGQVVRFAHPLLASAASALLGDDERGALHRRLADAVHDPEERARHRALAAKGPDAKAARVVEEAATAAFARGAPRSAAELAAESRRLTPPARGGDLRRRALAEAEYRFESGDADGACAVLEDSLEALAGGVERARLLSRLARYRHFRDDVRAGVELLGRALPEARGDPRLEGEIEEGLAWGLLLMRGDSDRAAAHARSAARSARRSGDPAALAEALAAQALTEFMLARAWRARMDEALELESATLELRVLRQPSFALGYCLSCADELDRARGIFRELRRRAEEHGDESSLAPILNHLALVECLAGRWDVAARLAGEAYDIALGTGQQPSQASILAKLALVAARRGADADARGFAGRSLELAAGPDFDPAQPERALARGGETAIWAVGALELSLGAAEEAARFLVPLARRLLAAGIREPGELRCLPDVVEALLGTEELDAAEEFAAALEKRASAVGRPSSVALAHRCRGLVLAARGDADAAAERLERAVAAHAAAPLPFERARTLLALGATRRRARRSGARDALEAARAEFERLGADVYAEISRAELARVGGRRRAGGLTETERRLAELVAQGRSNKEAAAALYVTPKTVETQLSRIYAKLGIRSRAELARRFAERNL